MAHKLYIAGLTDVEQEVTPSALRGSTSAMCEVHADPESQSHDGARNYVLEGENTSPPPRRVEGADRLPTALGADDEADDMRRHRSHRVVTRSRGSARALNRERD